VAFSIVFVHEFGGLPEIEEEVAAEELEEDINPLADAITRSHIIDFSVSCWS
jgi:hypothetical protein